MAGSYKDFCSYTPDFTGQNVRLADGSGQSIKGVGTVKCCPNMTLSSVLHVPSFPINLLSISCITGELNCAVIFFATWCLFLELGTWKILGTGIMRGGLYYLDDDMAPMAAAVLSQSPLEEFLLHHRRLGHISFNTLDLDNEIGGDKGEEYNEAASRNMIVGVIPAADMYDDEDEGTSEAEQKRTQGELRDESNEAVKWPKPNEEQEVQVYKRRQWPKPNEEQEVQVYKRRNRSEKEVIPSRCDHEAQEAPAIQAQETLPSVTQSDVHESSPQVDELDIPIARRKHPRSTAGKLPSNLSQYDISNYVSYVSLGSQYKSFIDALDSTLPIPRDWQEAKQYPEWRAAMIEEMTALDKNNTWAMMMMG
ncbi:uncharacterized protein LOC125535694 [Triticum urartu]|uniref:uncharacterized protein LOC125535694 n=1 Tax=Triticum urartu TaxID=4572 RepID=UPI002042D446|nr:uncharacterized protein LOC125535694 [Triticum urartu]